MSAGDFQRGVRVCVVTGGLPHCDVCGREALGPLDALDAQEAADDNEPGENGWWYLAKWASVQISPIGSTVIACTDCLEGAIRMGQSMRGNAPAPAETTCEYCNKLNQELRPYGVNKARICFACAMRPENKAHTEQVMRARFDALGDAVTIGGADGPRDMTAADLSDPAVEIFVTDPESKVRS